MLLEQDRLKSLSAQLQHKIAEYFAKKKVKFGRQILHCFDILHLPLQTEERPDPGRNVTDQEKRYNQCMGE